MKFKILCLKLLTCLIVQGSFGNNASTLTLGIQDVVT